MTCCLTFADFKGDDAPSPREALWQKWFGMGLLSATSALCFADAGGADKDSLIKGFMGGYIPSACLLGYSSFVTGEQDTLISKVCWLHAWPCLTLPQTVPCLTSPYLTSLYFLLLFWNRRLPQLCSR